MSSARSGSISLIIVCSGGTTTATVGAGAGARQQQSRHWRSTRPKRMKVAVIMKMHGPPCDACAWATWAGCRGSLDDVRTMGMSSRTTTRDVVTGTAPTVGAVAARADCCIFSGPSSCVKKHLQRGCSSSRWACRHCLISADEWPVIWRHAMMSSAHGLPLSASAAATSAGSSPIEAIGYWSSSLAPSGSGRSWRTTISIGRPSSMGAKAPKADASSGSTWPARSGIMRVSCASSGGSVAPPMGPETVLEWPSASVVIMVKKPPASPSCCVRRRSSGRGLSSCWPRSLLIMSAGVARATGAGDGSGTLRWRTGRSSSSAQLPLSVSAWRLRHCASLHPVRTKSFMQGFCGVELFILGTE
mmetsp:Transcript_39027/g.97311  ORF Transcript_39027/g.97311 Transcript_39027/m.97311 type:complete len:359 (+) Transcript_39027:547-1623(+)